MAEIPRTVRAAVRQHTDALLSYPNVIGVGVARKARKGRMGDEYAVVAYVSRKLPLEFLHPHERIPRELHVDDDSVLSDVVEIAEPRLLAVDTAQYRPLKGGSQIQTTSGTGTLGAILFDSLDHQPVLLSNNHVLTTPGSPNLLPSDTRVAQPAGGPVIGNTKRIVPMFRAPLGETGYNFAARVDAGIVAPLSTVALDFSVADLGRHPYVVLPPFEGLAVEHRGFRTQLRSGTVEAVDLTIVSKASNGDRHRIGGPGSGFSIRAPERLIGAWPGDSGSLVVDATRGASRGLVFSGDGLSGGLTFACELGAVMAELQLETACAGELNAFLRRAIFRRLTVAWAAAEERHGGVGGHTNALVEEMVDKTARFRHQHLPDERNGRVSGALGTLLYRSAADLAEALHRDEDFAGLLDRAFGDWLVLPTVYDMLEYRIPEHFGPMAITAFRRLGERCELPEEMGALEGALSRCAGLTMRELLEHSTAAGSAAV
ncbi:MAG: hypothetical protein ABJD07_12510 [Gemmatimonadaceae bacterium]